MWSKTARPWRRMGSETATKRVLSALMLWLTRECASALSSAVVFLPGTLFLVAMTQMTRTWLCSSGWSCSEPPRV